MKSTFFKCRGMLCCVSFLLIVSSFFGVLLADDNAWSHVRYIPQVGSLAWERYPAEGFAWPTSVAPGQQLKFYVSVRDINGGHSYRIEIFRLPDLNTVLWTSSDLAGTFYPLRDASGAPIYPGDESRKPVDFKLGCKSYWEPTAVAYTVPALQSSGLYIARLNHLSLAEADTHKYYYMPFVVRSANPGGVTQILFKFDFNTWQAYNYWGGGSLYSYPQDSLSLTSTDTIAVDRPIQWELLRSITWGFTDYLNTIGSLGYAMDYCNNIDVDSLPSSPSDIEGINLLAKYKMLVLYFHDEYWSLGERTNVELFKGPTYSGNIARFAPNTCFWQIHWWPTQTSGHFKLYCQKDNWRDPQNHPPLDLWRYDGPGGLNNPEAKFLGEQFEKTWGDTANDEPPDTVYQASHWIFNGTGLGQGSPFGFGFIQDNVRHGLTSGEWDNTVTGRAEFPLDTLAQSWIPGADGGGPDLVQMVYFEDTTSNARVFAEGHSGWNNAVNANADHPDDVTKMRTITANIFDHFSGKKYTGSIWYPVSWNSNVELDGNVYLLPGRSLTLSNNMTLTVDADDTLFIGGTLQVNSNVTVSGAGFIQVEPGGRINVNGYVALGSGVALELKPGCSLVFGASSRVLTYGKFSAQGSPSNRITLDGQGYTRSGMLYPMVLVASGGTADIQYADFNNAAFELALWTNSGNSTIRNCSFTNFGYTSDSKALTVYSAGGPVAIVGNVFAGSNSQGIAVYCQNTGTGVRMDSNSIGSAGTGIRSYSSGASMKFNTIHDNFSYGIQCDNVPSTAKYDTNDVRFNGTGLLLNSSSPWVMRSILVQNSLNVLVNGGSPNFAIPGDLTGHNTIAYAGAPLLRAQNYGFAYLGYDYDGGYNSLYETDLPHLWITNHSGVWADNNYWGDTPTYYADGTSWATVKYPLATNPNPDPLGKIMIPKSSGGIAWQTLGKTEDSGQDSTSDALFQTAVRAAINGEVPAAKAGLETLIGGGSTKYASLALHVYYDLSIGRWSGLTAVGGLQNEVKSFLLNVAAEPVSSFLRPFALRLLARDAAMSRDDSTANIYRLEILKDYPGSIHELPTMYDLVVYYVLAGNDLKKAQETMAKMSALYPDDWLTFMAKAEVGERVDFRTLGKHEAGALIEQRLDFALSEAYPNPFNPSTTLQFSVPISAHVHLKVYDVLGREILTLVDAAMSAGVQHAVVDARSLSSGMYYARLTVMDELGATKFSKASKLLLVR